MVLLLFVNASILGMCIVSQMFAIGDMAQMVVLCFQHCICLITVFPSCGLMTAFSATYFHLVPPEIGVCCCCEGPT